jgi:hypothetical protein
MTFHHLMTRIGSATELDLLLLLYRSPETFWTAAAACSVLEASEDTVRSSLEKLERAGLIERGKATEAFRYSPALGGDHEAVVELAEAWVHHRNDVLRAIAR